MLETKGYVFTDVYRRTILQILYRRFTDVLQTFTDGIIFVYRRGDFTDVYRRIAFRLDETREFVKSA